MVKVTGKSLSSLEITIVFQKKSFFKKMSLQITFKNFKIGSAYKILRKIIPQFCCGGYKGWIAKGRESPSLDCLCL